MGIIKAFLEALKAMFEYLGIRTSNKAGDVIVRVADIYDAMKELINEPEYGIGRVLILYAHNGGLNLAASTPTYVSCIHEEIRPPFYSVKGDYQKLPIDGAYNRLLMDVFLKKQVDINVNDLDDNTLLKKIYQDEKIEKSRVYFLKHTKKAFWFMSIASDSAKTDFDQPSTYVALVKALSIIKPRI